MPKTKIKEVRHPVRQWLGWGELSKIVDPNKRDLWSFPLAEIMGIRDLSLIFPSRPFSVISGRTMPTHSYPIFRDEPRSYGLFPEDH